jgi:hypothetical protein
MTKQELVYIVLVPRVGLIVLMAKQGLVYIVLVPRVSLIVIKKIRPTFGTSTI